MEIENTIIEKVEKVKKIKKQKACDVYFDDQKDNKIILEYSNIENDIMTISNLNNVRPWEVVSLLMRYKIIITRGDARGYDKYKETEEYKSKLIK